RKDMTISGDEWAKGTSSGPPPASKLEATVSGSVTYTSAPLVAGFEFKALAVTWSPALPDGATIAVEVRVSDDGVTWQPWRTAPAADAARDSAPPSGTDLILEQGRVAQVRVTLDQGLARTPPSLTELTTHFLRPENLPTPAEALAAANAAKAASGDALKPAIVPRAAYGAPETYVEWDDCSRAGSSDRQGYMKPQAFAVHHTADNSVNLTGPEWAYAVWYYHTYVKGWGDTGYHYMVDRAGIIYQGRTPGTATAPYLVEGGHVYDYNCSSGGVVALGNYQPGIDVPLTPLTDQTLQGLSKVLAWLMDSYGWRPWDTRWVKDIAVYGLAGHRDFGGTVCPGQDLYDRLPELRDRVEALLDSEPSPTATPTVPAPATATPRPRDPTPAPPGSTPTLGAGCRDVMRQGDFSLYDQWELSGNGALTTTFDYVSAPRSLFLGRTQAQADSPGWAMAAQRGISLPRPVERARLSFWYAPFADGADGDIHRVELQDTAGNTLPGGWLMNQQPPQNTRGWTLFQADVTDALRAADGNVTLVFSVYNDGNGLKTYMRVDDVVLEVCGGATPTPSRTPTATPTRTPRPTATPLPVACTDWTRNSGFEVGDTLPLGWTLQDGGVDVGLSSENHTSGGARSLRLGRSTPGGTMGYAAAWQDFTWPSGVTSATLRFAYKAQGGDSGDRRVVEVRDVTTGERVTLWALDGAQDTGWQTVEIPVTLRPVGHAAQVYFALLDQGGANAEILIDDVSLELCGRGLGGPWRMYLPGVWSGGGE
ncbi:MAG: N-acetylmuramoyl-L-alanine amidase, partial [Anaerolineae bacterium]|nr:N-acetylmuramoyl-L-alanine amidase [Anaerolineae bacterium]